MTFCSLKKNGSLERKAPNPPPRAATKKPSRLSFSRHTRAVASVRGRHQMRCYMLCTAAVCGFLCSRELLRFATTSAPQFIGGRLWSARTHVPGRCTPHHHRCAPVATFQKSNKAAPPSMHAECAKHHTNNILNTGVSTARGTHGADCLSCTGPRQRILLT